MEKNKQSLIQTEYCPQSSKVMLYLDGDALELSQHMSECQICSKKVNELKLIYKSGFDKIPTFELKEDQRTNLEMRVKDITILKSV